jgi:FdhD protein
MKAPRPGSRTKAVVRAVEDGRSKRRTDELVTEEPLEIRLNAGGAERTVAVTMRTPGADFELAAGFLYGEGVIAGKDDLTEIRYCLELDVEQHYNVVTADLIAPELPDLGPLERHFYTTSACGVCGRTTLDDLKERGYARAAAGPVVPAGVVRALPDALRAAQPLFGSTGGLHAAALFTAAGDVVCVREDVGRHNAVDKVVGWSLMEERLPASESILLVSGRASFEIVQKAVAAGIPIVCAVSAPSSLAVDVARDFGLTLIGFLRGDRFNVYTGEERLDLASA